MLTLNREMLLRAYPAAPQTVNQRIDDTLALIHQQATARPPKRYAVRLSFAMVLTVILIVMAAVGIAAGIRFGVFDFMAQIFDQGGVLPQAGELVQENLADMETEHTAITLAQAVYDGGNLRIVYSVRQKGAAAPITSDELNDETSCFRKALAADDVSPWGCDWFYLDGTDVTMTGGSTVTTIPGTENGEALCYMDIYLASSGIVPQGDFTMSLPIIRHGAKDLETLDFTVKADAPAVALPAQQANGLSVSVLSASLSPARAYVTLRIEPNASLSALEAELLLADWQDAQLVDGAGNELSPIAEFMQTNVTEGNTVDYSFTFYPTDAAEAYIAPTIITENDEWLVDMTQAIQVK